MIFVGTTYPEKKLGYFLIKITIIYYIEYFCYNNKKQYRNIFNIIYKKNRRMDNMNYFHGKIKNVLFSWKNDGSIPFF